MKIWHMEIYESFLLSLKKAVWKKEKIEDQNYNDTEVISGKETNLKKKKKIK